MADMRSESLQALQKAKIPDMLWHYTSLDAFRQIVENKGNIRGTHLNYVNDLEEVINGAEIVERVIKELLPTCEALEMIRGIYNELMEKRVGSYFVASFTERKDQLSQWRGYSHGSPGVSLGYDLRLLQDASLTTSSLAPCIYSKEDKVSVIQSILNPIPDVTPEAMLKPVQELIQVSALMKDESFDEEDEWRIVIYTNDVENLKYRTGRATLIPFIEMEIGGGLSEVMLGPGSDPRAEDVTKLFLAAHGFPAVNVARSDAPYMPLR